MMSSWEDAFEPVDEEARQSFEVELRGNRGPRIHDFLPPKDSEFYAGTLEELVLIDLEHRWAQAQSTHDTVEESAATLESDAPPMIETYVREFPELANETILARLIEEEFHVRQRFSTTPTMEEYRRRFPDVELSDTLRPRDLGLDTWGDEAPVGQEADFQPESRYDELREYARGGMGVIYKAEDTRFGRQVAIKHLQSPFVDDNHAFTRFTNEAKLAGRLEHPGIVPVYDMGTSDSGTPYYSMKLVQGVTLEHMIETAHQNLTPAALRELLNVLSSVSRTIAYAHDQQVIHRDLKPANVVVGNYGDNIVLDWGLAKDLSAEEQFAKTQSAAAPLDATQAGTVIGTPAYMSPEQARGDLEQIDRKADVYALGAMLFHVLTGRPSITTQQEFQQFRQGNLRFNPKQLNPRTPDALTAICRKAMHREPTERYGSAAAFADDLELFMADEPISAFRDPWSTRLWRWARRHQRLVAAAVFLVVLSTITSVAAGFVNQAQAAQRSQQISNIQAVVDTNQDTALEEIKAGRFVNGVSYFAKAMELCEPDPYFADQLTDLQQKHAAAKRLVEFERTADRVELLAWDEVDEDAVILVRRALASVNTFQHRDWWQHMTEFELDPTIEDKLRNRVFRELAMLVALHLKQGAVAVDSADQFLLGGNAESRTQFEAARVPLEALQRFRGGLGSNFAEALCDQQLEPGVLNTAKLVTATRGIFDHAEIQNATDRFFIGLPLVFYAQTVEQDPDHPIVKLINQVRPLLGKGLQFDDSAEAALGHLRNAAADEPSQLWTAFTQGWTEEMAQRYHAAINAFTRSIALDPQEPRAYLHRSFQYSFLSDVEEDPDAAKRYRHRALADLQMGEHLSPQNADFLWRKSFVVRYSGHAGSQNAGLLLAMQAAKIDAPLPELVHAPVLREYRRGEYYYCLQYVTELLEQEPELGEAWLLSALLNWRLQQQEQAERSLRKANELGCEPATASIVAGEMALAKEEFDAAQEHFEECLRASPGEYLAMRGLALLHLERGDHAEALSAFRELLRQSQYEWQTFENLKWSCVAAIHVGADAQVLADMEQILDLRPSAACKAIVETLEAQGDASLLSRVQEQLKNRAPVPMFPPPRANEGAAFLNGDFELPLNKYWESSAERPIVWWNQGDCRSLGEVTSNTQRHGRYCLQIQNFSSKQPGVEGGMQQVFPTERRAKYQIRLAAKAEQALEDSVFLRVRAKGAKSNRATVVLSIPEGSADWNTLETTFEAKSDETVLEIVTADRCLVWLDDLQIVRLAD